MFDLLLSLVTELCVCSLALVGGFKDGPKLKAQRAAIFHREHFGPQCSSHRQPVQSRSTQQPLHTEWLAEPSELSVSISHFGSCKKNPTSQSWGKREAELVEPWERRRKAGVN